MAERRASVGRRPTASQRRLLERLAAGADMRLPPWGKRVQLVATGEPGQHVADATFRVLLRYGWIERASGPTSQVPTYRLSAAGRSTLAATPVPERLRKRIAFKSAARRAEWPGGQGATRPT